tara:strand:+ start:474 stop:824 length:351 start_codon:yes stop_codon:yes gene_type:complete
MAFILDDLEDTFDWKVKLPIPTKNKREVHTFTATFKRITQDRFEELARLQRDEGLSNTEICKEIMVGWSDMLDTEGNELPFSDAYVNKFLDVAGVAAFIADAFSEAYTGGLKRKNY